MPKRIEDIEKENRLTIFDQLKGLPPREMVKRAIVIFWYGMLGKKTPPETSSPGSSPATTDEAKPLGS